MYVCVHTYMRKACVIFVKHTHTHIFLLLMHFIIITLVVIVYFLFTVYTVYSILFFVNYFSFYLTFAPITSLSSLPILLLISNAASYIYTLLSHATTLFYLYTFTYPNRCLSLYHHTFLYMHIPLHLFPPSFPTLELHLMRSPF